MINKDLSVLIDSKDLIDITDKLNLRSYLHEDPESGERKIHIRISKDGLFDIGLDLGYHSKKILESIKID